MDTVMNHSFQSPLNYYTTLLDSLYFMKKNSRRQTSEEQVMFTSDWIGKV